MPKIKNKNNSYFAKISNYRIVIFFSNFIFQGMRYMELGERLFKLSITFFFTGVMYILDVNLLLSLLLAHFINFIINGQFYVLARYLFSQEVINKLELERFISIISDTFKKFYIVDVLVIGSFCRGEMKSSSDLDIRLYHKPGILNSLIAYCYAFYLRLISMYYKFPMDVYCFSNLKFMDKIREDENPSYFYGDHAILSKYPNSNNVFDDLKRNIDRWPK